MKREINAGVCKATLKMQVGARGGAVLDLKPSPEVKSEGCKLRHLGLTSPGHLMLGVDG